MNSLAKQNYSTAAEDALNAVSEILTLVINERLSLTNLSNASSANSNTANC